MNVIVHLFARAKDLAGASSVAVDLAEGATVAQLRRQLAEHYPPLARLLNHSAFAVNDDFADDSQPIPANAAVALLPPVSGG
jgi:molybdopterin converting factor subunit 1